MKVRGVQGGRDGLYSNLGASHRLATTTQPGLPSGGSRKKNWHHFPTSDHPPSCGYTLGTTRSRSFSTKNQHLENRHSLLFNIWQLEHFPCTAVGYATLFLGRCLGISRNIQQFAAADPLVGERQRYSLLELAERMLSSCRSTGYRSFGWTLVAGLDWPMLDG